jgi:hypothetical protein
MENTLLTGYSFPTDKKDYHVKPLQVATRSILALRSHVYLSFAKIAFQLHVMLHISKTFSRN